MLTELVRQGVQAFGIQGVSAGVLALLVAVALYSHKAASAGQRVVLMGSTVTHDVKIVALVLTGLLIIGVISMDLERAHELGRQLNQFNWSRWIERLEQWVESV